MSGLVLLDCIKPVRRRCQEKKIALMLATNFQLNSSLICKESIFTVGITTVAVFNNFSPSLRKDNGFGIFIFITILYKQHSPLVSDIPILTHNILTCNAIS